MYKFTYEEVKKNIEKHLKRVKVDGNLPFPNTVLLDTCPFCNLHCSFCPHDRTTRPKAFMDWQLYKKIIDEIAEKNPYVHVYMVFSGEGLIMKDLPERIKYAKEKGLKRVILNTNSVLMTKEWAERLVKAGLDVLYPAVDGITQETYGKIRIGGDLKKAIQGVLNYREALQKYGRSDQKMYVQFVETEENVHEEEELIRFWHEKGIPVKLRPQTSWGGKVRADHLKLFPERLPCYWALTTMVIINNGDVSLCAVDIDCEYNKGNVRKESIENVWNGELKEFRELHLKGMWDKLPELCRNCRDWQAAYADYVEIGQDVKRVV